VLIAARWLAAGVLGEPPLDLPRDEARAAAVAELAKPEYRVGEPNLATRVLRWVLEQANRLLAFLSDAVPGGLWGVAVLMLVVALAVVAVKVGVGPIGRSAGGERAIFVGQTRSAAEHRARADAAAQRADWHDAVIERYRALVRSLEERGLVDERPGRTADEAADEGAAALPSAAALLRPAARAFDDIAYGGRAADAAAHTLVREAEESARAARPALGAPA
jgi:hypothetical protein